MKLPAATARPFAGRPGHTISSLPPLSHASSSGRGSVRTITTPRKQRSDPRPLMSHPSKLLTRASTSQADASQQANKQAGSQAGRMLDRRAGEMLDGLRDDEDILQRFQALEPKKEEKQPQPAPKARWSFEDLYYPDAEFPEDEFGLYYPDDEARTKLAVMPRGLDLLRWPSLRRGRTVMPRTVHPYKMISAQLLLYRVSATWGTPPDRLDRGDLHKVSWWLELEHAEDPGSVLSIGDWKGWCSVSFEGSEERSRHALRLLDWLVGKNVPIHYDYVLAGRVA